MRQILILFSIIICHLATKADSLESLFQVKGLSPEDSSVYIEDIINGDIICDWNGGKPLQPASTTKLVTTAAASLLLSYDSRWPTVAELSGMQVDSVFYGDLRVISFGDPTLGSSKFSGCDFSSAVAKAVCDLGISKIVGEICVDEANRVDSGAPQGWQEGDLTSNYGAVYRATNFADNHFSYSYPSGNTQPLVEDLDVKVVAGRRGISVSKDPWSNRLVVAARKKRGNWTGVFPNSDPRSSLIAELRKALDDNGVAITARSAKINGEAVNQHLLTHYSPTLGEVMRLLMVRSDNMLAESVLRLQAPGQKHSKAVDNELKLFDELDIQFEEDQGRLSLVDGSGLSRHNRLNAYFLADVLHYMATSEVCVPYVGLFPKAGIEGTVKSLLTGSRLEGKMVLKSGSLNNVQCYAGYLLDDEGLPSHIVVMMFNEFKGNRAQLRESITDFLVDTLPE